MQSVVLVERRVEEAVGVVVHVRRVRHSVNRHHRVVVGTAVLTAPREHLGAVDGRGVRPDAQTVHVRSHVREREVDVEALSADRVAARIGRLAHIHHLCTVGGRGGVALRDRVARAVGHSGRQKRHEGVEVHIVRGGGEVKLHSQHALRRLHLLAGTDKATETRLRVLTRRRRRIRNGALGHVVTVHFGAVQVRHDTVSVVETRLVGSHSRNTGEGLAEVLRARELRGDGAQRDRGPAAVTEGVLRPARSSTSGHLPLRILHHGIVQGQGVRFRGQRRHHVFEEDIVVNAANLQPRARTPRIAVTIA